MEPGTRITELLAVCDERPQADVDRFSSPAFRALLERTYAGIKARAVVAMRRKHGPQLDHLTTGPTDLVNEVVLRLGAQRKLGENGDQFFANVMRLVVRTMTDHLRNRARQVQKKNREKAGDRRHLANQPVDHVLKLSDDEFGLRLAAELDAMSRDSSEQAQAQAIHLKYIEGLTHDQIAEVLCIAGITVRREIDRGMTKLLQRLDSSSQ